MTRRRLEVVEVVDFQKRKAPSKHYVYVISVTWSDGSVNVVYRRYSRFFELQTKLLEEFPDEGGVKDPSKRILPFLPGKIIFGRSNIRDVALRRMEPLNDYCKALITLPALISEFDPVIRFFEPTPEDIALPQTENDKKKKKKDYVDNISDPVVLEQYVAIADYQKQNRAEVNMVAGDVVEVIDKNENGWWFVNVDEEQGWVPGAYLEPADGSEDVNERMPEGQEENFITTSAHKAENDDEISFEMGVIVSVLQKNFDGWWLVRHLGQEGWAPAMYLKKADPSQVQIANSAATKSREQRQTSATASPTTARGRAAAAKSGRKVPPRRTTVKRSIKKLPVCVDNMSYEKTLVGDNEQEFKKSLEFKSPDAEYFTVGDFKALGIDRGLTFNEGVSVQVLEKAPNGWWFGKINNTEGWIPSSYLGKREKQATPPDPRISRKPDAPRQLDNKEQGTKLDKPIAPKRPESPRTAKRPGRPPLPGKTTAAAQDTKTADFRANLAAALSSHAPSKADAKRAISGENTPDGESYEATADYDDESEGVLSFRQGAVARVLEMSDGWWFASIDGNEGWVPASYFCKLESKAKAATAKPKRPQPPRPQRETKPSVPTKPTVAAKPGATRAPIPAPRIPGNLTSDSSAVSTNKKSSKPARPKPVPQSRKPGATQTKETAAHAPAGVTPGASVVTCTCIAVASYEGSDGLNFQEGDAFEFLEDSNTGWWFVRSRDGRENWAPANYLQKKVTPAAPPRPAKPAAKKPVKPVFVAVASYQDDDEAVSFKEGDHMEVLEQDDGGWWLVKLNGNTGWAPSNYLQPL